MHQWGIMGSPESPISSSTTLSLSYLCLSLFLSVFLAFVGSLLFLSSFVPPPVFLVSELSNSVGLSTVFWGC